MISSNKILQRIYGILSFCFERSLGEHFHFIDEAQKRNHRKLGNELELFMSLRKSPGMPFYLANGQMIRNELESFFKKVTVFL